MNTPITRLPWQEEINITLSQADDFIEKMSTGEVDDLEPSLRIALAAALYQRAIASALAEIAFHADATENGLREVGKAVQEMGADLVAEIGDVTSVLEERTPWWRRRRR